MSALLCNPWAHEGNYEMVNDLGESFDVEIPLFSLDSPMKKLNLINLLEIFQKNI